MNIDQTGVNLIKSFEGYRRLPYVDVAGKMTVGIGHLIQEGEDFSAGLTEDEAEALLAGDLALPELTINQQCPQANQNQFDALCSFAFNLGVGSLKTMLAHGWDQVPTQMLRWDKSGGQQVPGLTRRRQAEVALFNS